ncbi:MULTISPECIES: Ca2+-dependent phosphoinositide-specific phospholipase C [Rheinheimera]|uniref:Ca2+-dependent phosphoinositide-specific phospholipase C n=1 Tax=Rheinheimera marina TaxID=1774958 RepID=A0ABV9JPI9_9GAMM
MRYWLLLWLLSCMWSVQASPRLNQLQWLGSHNSYKQAIPLSVQQYLQQQGQAQPSLYYSHPPLQQQLELGLRHLELDFVLDAKTGDFARPLAEQWQGDAVLSGAERAALQQPGIKVLHIPDLDPRSHCPLLSQCLAQLKAWSVAHPQHLPVWILVNIKETGSAGGVTPKRWSLEDYQQLDQQLRRELGAERLFTPDQLRQAKLTLEQSVLRHGWPELDQARGRFLFILDGQPAQLELYRQQHPALQGRVMFGNYSPGAPEAAVLLRNQPQLQLAELNRLSALGYIVRTRADEFVPGSDQSVRQQLALSSRAQIISTDSYQGAPQQQGMALRFPFSPFVRCLPVYPDCQLSAPY